VLAWHSETIPTRSHHPVHCFHGPAGAVPHTTGTAPDDSLRQDTVLLFVIMVLSADWPIGHSLARCEQILIPSLYPSPPAHKKRAV